MKLMLSNQSLIAAIANATPQIPVETTPAPVETTPLASPRLSDIVPDFARRVILPI